MLIGFAITAANLRAQAMACILLWKLLSDRDATKAGLEGDAEAGFGATVGTKAVTMVKLVEFFFEAIPELLLQGYALLYRHHVDGAGMADGNALLLASLSISFATLVSGLTATFLGANDAAVMALGAAYFLCIVFGRMALFGLLFLQFGQLAAIFASAALLLRIAYVVCADHLRGVDDDQRLTRTIFDAPTLVIVPVGMDTGEDGDYSRAVGHIDPNPASIVLYGPDARWSLAMHVAEAAVGAVLLHTCGGRSIAPYRAAGHAAGSGPGGGDGGGPAGPAEVELVVEPADILWYIVGPYCAGLAVLALLVVLDKNWPTNVHVHLHIFCNGSGACPIIGTRYHKVEEYYKEGSDLCHYNEEDYDLCHAEFVKLSEEERSAFEVIRRPGDVPIPYAGADNSRLAVALPSAGLAGKPKKDGIWQNENKVPEQVAATEQQAQPEATREVGPRSSAVAHVYLHDVVRETAV